MTVLRNLLMASTYLTKLDVGGLDARQLQIDLVDVSDRIYINANGDDTSGDGSETNPYKTIDYVRDNIVNTQKGKTIILAPETYTVSWEQNYGHQWRIIGTKFADTDIIGFGYGTVIECLGVLSGVDSTFFGSNGGSVNVWGVHFKRDGNGRTINHQCSICSNGGGSSYGTYPTTTMVFTNCIIEEVGSGYASLTYMGNANSYTFNNCSFKATWTSNYSGASYLTLNNCALTNGPVYGSAVKNNVIDQVSFDTDYKINNGGINLDGGGDYLSVAASPDFEHVYNVFNSDGDFTYELLSRFSVITSYPDLFSFNGTTHFNLEIYPGNKISWYQGGHIVGPLDTNPVLTTGGNLTHWAVTREGDTVSVWQDGNLLGSSTNTDTLGSSSLPFVLGRGSGNDFNGQLDQCRISNVARYSGTFSPSTEKFVNDANTLLLIQDGFTDTSSRGHVVTKNGDISISSDSYHGVYSGFYGFDGAQTKSGLDFTQHRYWKFELENTPGGGYFHNELEIYEGSDKINLSGAVLTQQGLNLINGGLVDLIDGSTAGTAIYTDTSVAGDYLKIDAGAGNKFTISKARFYMSNSVNALWTIKGSDNGTNFITYATGFDVSGGAGWKEIYI